VGSESYFIQPTIFTDVKEDMKFMQEEIFGPVVCLSKFKDIDEAVELANNTNYGLAAAVFSQNVETCFRKSSGMKSTPISTIVGLTNLTTKA
jgi:aldehyde dehydrogenase (NAD+)